MTNPQNVSSKYTRNLICNGKNSNFEIDLITQNIAKSPENLPVGFYYNAIVKRAVTFVTESADGATPEHAVQRALVKHGVTFR